MFTLFIFALFYFIPWLCSLGKPQSAPVFVINLFLGWTCLGWIIALAMAVAPNNQAVAHASR